MTSQGFDLIAAVTAHERRRHRERCWAEVLRALTALSLLLTPGK